MLQQAGSADGHQADHEHQQQARRDPVARVAQVDDYLQLDRIRDLSDSHWAATGDPSFLYWETAVAIARLRVQPGFSRINARALARTLGGRPPCRATSLLVLL